MFALNFAQSTNIDAKIKQLKAYKDEILKEVKNLETYKSTISEEIAEWIQGQGVDKLNGLEVSSITINKGSYNGIKKDMVVINGKGLIGRVIKTSTFTSDVRLITTSDTNNKISVHISNGDYDLYGLINSYDYNKNVLELEGISNTKDVNIGDYVYTSGLGGVFPTGILIGIVEEITTDSYDLAKIIKVKPSADFNDINYVSILKRKSDSK